MVRLLSLTALATGLLLAADTPDFSGKWQLDPSKSKGKVSEAFLEIKQGPDQIHMKKLSSTNEMLLDLTCGTRGKECEVTDEGKPAKVSLWYNGPSLVLLETVGAGGEEVTKKSLKMNGKSLEIEFQRIVPPGETETFVFNKE